MAKRKLITDPGTIFRLFCGEYRLLTPYVWISPALAQRIDRFIEDAAECRTITPFRETELTTFGPVPGSVACSIYFIEYLKRPSREMTRQQHFTVLPQRACELLYNLDADENYSIEIMDLETVHADDFLVSCGFRWHLELALFLGTARETDDWTLSG